MFCSRNGNGAFATKENTQNENIRYPLRNAYKKLCQVRKDVQYSPLNPLNIEKSSPEPYVPPKTTSPDTSRRRGITKYDQDLIEKCTFTETRCRPLAGKRKIELDSVYTPVKRPRKAVHIIRGKPSAIARRLKANSLKKLTFRPIVAALSADEPVKATMGPLFRNSDAKTADECNSKGPGPVKIKLKRKKKRKVEYQSVANNSDDINATNCNSCVDVKLNCLYEDFLNDFKIDNTTDDDYTSTVSRRLNGVKRNYLYEQVALHSKDVYEFNEEDDNAIQPLPRKGTNGKSESPSAEVPLVEVPSAEAPPPEAPAPDPPVREVKHSGKLKLTLKMKKSFVLDNVFGMDKNMRVVEPQYEVLSIEAE